jgi:hypothetical protein
MFCRNCGKQIDDNSKFCEFCGTSIVVSSSQNIPPSYAPVPPQTDNIPVENHKNMTLIVLGYICWGFALIDFCGMFFDYDLTGVSWSPLVAGAIGYGLNYLGNKN